MSWCPAQCQHHAHRAHGHRDQLVRGVRGRAQHLPSRAAHISKQAIPTAAPTEQFHLNTTINVSPPSHLLLTPPYHSSHCHPPMTKYEFFRFQNDSLHNKKDTSRNARKGTRKQLKKETQKLLRKQSCITNLSSKSNPNPPQIDVLSLGLTFVPSRTQSQIQLSKSLDSFDRSNTSLKVEYPLSHTPSEKRVRGCLQQHLQQ